MENEIYFTNEHGKKLHGVLNFPEGELSPLVVFCHGYASDVQSKTRVHLSSKFLEKGIGTFAFDFTGCGKSSGKLGELTLSRGISDLKSAFEYLAFLENVDHERMGIVGSSFGGSVAILASQYFDTKCIALKSPASDYSKLAGEEVLSDGERKVFAADAKLFDIYNAASKIITPTLIVHGTKDADVPIEQSKTLNDKITCEKKFIEIIDANHRYENEMDFSKMIEEIFNWTTKHI